MHSKASSICKAMGHATWAPARCISVARSSHSPDDVEDMELVLVDVAVAELVPVALDVPAKLTH